MHHCKHVSGGYNTAGIAKRMIYKEEQKVLAKSHVRLQLTRHQNQRPINAIIRSILGVRVPMKYNTSFSRHTWRTMHSGIVTIDDLQGMI